MTISAGRGHGRTRSVRPLLAALAAGFLVLGAGALPAQAETGAIADWQMDEAPGALTMSDSGGRFPGAVGDEVTTGVEVDGARGYSFLRLKPNTPPARPGHNVLVPHDPVLNPAGRALYAVEVRLRTNDRFGNVVQKGQAGARGGYWKIQLPQAEPSCLFRGPGGVTNSVRARGLPLNDGVWHTIRCEATPSEVRLYVDGRYIGRNRGETDVIANDQPVSIGGKDFCDQVRITCDYFAGQIDYVRLEGTV